MFGQISIAGWIIFGIVMAWFGFSVWRTWYRGTCADCAAAGVCTGHCGREHQKHCAAFKGLDEVEKELSQGIK